MRPAIRDFESPDIWDLDHDVPEDQRHFCVLIQMDIGQVGSVGADLFSVVICTGSWMTNLAEEAGGYWFARHHLIVDRWDWPATAQLLENTIESLEAETWDELGETVSSYAGWEFEDDQTEPGGPRRTGDRTGRVRRFDEPPEELSAATLDPRDLVIAGVLVPDEPDPPGLLVAEVKSLDLSDDFEFTVDPTNFTENFAMTVELRIGPVGEAWSDPFSMVVCTGSWLTAYVADHGAMFTEHHLVVTRWDPVTVAGLLRVLFSRFEADNWDDLVVMICRYARPRDRELREGSTR